MFEPAHHPRPRWRLIALSAAIAAWIVALGLGVYANLAPGARTRAGWNAAAERKHEAIRAKLRQRAEFAGLKHRAEAGDVRTMLRVAFDFERGLMGAPKDARQAFIWRQRAADAKSVVAMVAVARAYESGNGTPPDAHKAVEWYRRAAERGSTFAARHLGDLYNEGTRIPADLPQAFHWYKTAADAGDAEAGEKVAACYETGRGVPADLSAAYYAYARLAESGRVSAELRVALMLQKGSGVDADPVEAVRWLQAAAQQGNPRALAELGSAYLHGRGVERDEAEGRRLLRRAAAAGDVSASVGLGGFDHGHALPLSTNDAAGDFLRFFDSSTGAPTVADLAPGQLNALGMPMVVRVPPPASVMSPADEKARLADSYLRARGKAQPNFVKARELFAEAAGQGSIRAKAKHALMVKNGVGGPRDVRSGVAELRAAADEFDPVAMACLAAAFIQGEPTAGVPRDPAAAGQLIDRIPGNAGIAEALKKQLMAEAKPTSPPITRAIASANPSTKPEPLPQERSVTVVHQEPPQYPIDLRCLDVDGEVTVDFIVDTTGKVVNPYAVRSSIPGFEAAAIAAVARWEFKPGMKAGKPVNTHLQVPIVFALHEETVVPPKR